MKALIIAVAFIPFAAAAQPVPGFDGLAWGMTRSEVASVVDRDVSEAFATEIDSVPCRVAFHFSADRLDSIAVDLGRDSLTPERAIAERAAIYWHFYGSLGPATTTRIDDDTSGACAGAWSDRFVRGCWRRLDEWDVPSAVIRLDIACPAGRITSTATISRPRPIPSSVDSQRPAFLLDLR